MSKEYRPYRMVVWRAKHPAVAALIDVAKLTIGLLITLLILFLLVQFIKWALKF